MLASINSKKGKKNKGIVQYLKIILIFLTIISSISLHNKLFTPAAVSAAEEKERHSLNLYIISPYSIKLEWKDNVSNKTGFVIQRSTDSGAFKSIASVRSNTTTYSDFNVSPGYVYTYRILYRNIHGDLNQHTVEASTSSDLISKPNTLELTSVSPAQIELKWTYPGYKQYDTIIERKTSKDGEWQVIYRVPAGTFKYTDEGLTSDVRYYYRIKAVTNSNIFSDYYPSKYGETIYTSLKAPKNLHGYAVSSTKIYLSWDYDEDEDDEYNDGKGNSKKVDYFEIDRKTENGDYIKIAIVPSTNTWYQNAGLTTGMLYTYRVRAKKGASYSDYSHEVTVNCGYINPPVALSARALSGNTIELEWENRGLDVGAQIEIWRKSDNYMEWDLFTVLDRNYSKFVDNNVEEGIKYSYKLRSVISYNNTYSNYSNEVSTYPSDYNTPSDINYTVIDRDRIQLYWKYEGDTNIAGETDDSYSSHEFKRGFIIEVKEDIFDQWQELAQVSPGSENYFVKGLDESKTYYFRVRAINDNAGIGTYSKEIKVITRIPETPEIRSITALSPSKIKIDWRSNLIDWQGSLQDGQNPKLEEASVSRLDKDLEAGFIIERKLGGLNYYKVIAILPPEADTYIDMDLSPYRRYDYRIKAFNKAGDSEYTKEIFAVTRSLVFFEDVPSSHPALEAIYDLAGRGVVNGMKVRKDNGKIEEVFYPDEAVTRAEFVCMLIRAYKPEGKAVGSFADVTYGDWFYEEVMIAKNLGIIEGDKYNCFYPDKPLTVEEMQKIINKVLKSKGKTLIYGSGQETGTGSVTGITDMKFDEGGIVTRGEAVIEIYNIIDSGT